MIPVYPLALSSKEMACNPEILTNCDLCRAKKTSHEISSLAYPQVCKQFKQETGKTHICIPMIIGGRTGGVVQFLFLNEDGQELDIADLQARIFKAATYIKQALSVIEAKRLMTTLRESALKDPFWRRRVLYPAGRHQSR